MNYFERKELKTVADDATVVKASGLMYKMMCHIKKKIVDQQFQIVRIAGFIKCREKNKLHANAKIRLLDLLNAREKTS